MDPQPLVQLVEDSAAMRATVACILRGDGFAVREHGSACGLLAHGALARTDCVLTDLRMPRIDGIELLTRLRAAGSTVPVVVMTGYGEVSMAVRAMKLGARDFIEKPFAPDTVLRAVRAAVRETETPCKATRQALANERLGRLTEREGEVLGWLLTGLSHREIGEGLSISPRTVEVFRSRIMAKAECRSVQELVRVALDAGRG